MSGAVTVFDLLSNERRLIFLTYLSERDWVTLSDAARHVASVERDVPPETIDRETRRRTRLSLVQTHVPKLVEAGVVAYDETGDRVRLVDERELLAPFRRDGRPGLATTVVGALGALGSLAGAVLGAVAVPAAAGQLVAFGVLILLGVRRVTRRDPSSVRDLAARLDYRSSN